MAWEELQVNSLRRWQPVNGSTAWLPGGFSSGVSETWPTAEHPRPPPVIPRVCYN